MQGCLNYQQRPAQYNNNSAVSTILPMKTSLIALILCLLSSTLAADCSAGEYYSSESTSCKQCHISCRSCNSGEGCSSCYDQMYFSPSGNQVVCDLCYNVLQHCQICISAQKCEKCSSGYVADNNHVCQTCASFAPNCVFCVVRGEDFRCVTCDRDYSMVEGVCQSDNVAGSTVAVEATVEPEVTASVITTPVVIQEEPLVIAEEPVQTTQQVASAATNSLSQGVVVVECQSYQIQLNGVCIISIPSCEQYNMQTLKCKVCKVTFTLSTQGFCIPESLLAGLIAAQTQAKAQTQAQVQSAATPNLGQSKEVSAQEQNQTSEDCIQNQYYWYGRCITIGTECVSKNAEGKCQECVLGYRVDTNRGLCIQLTPQVQTQTQQQASSSNAASTGQDPSLSQTEAPVQVPTPADSSSASACNLALWCLTCSEGQPDFCLTCLSGYTTVDVIPGRCFKL